MGRPRKRRREESGDIENRDGNIDVSDRGVVGVSHAEVEEPGLATLEPGLGTDVFHFPEHRLERHDIVPASGGSRLDLPSIDTSGLDSSGVLLADLEQGFPNWDISHDLGQSFLTPVDVPMQLQTPPNAPDELDNNNRVADNAAPGCSCLSDLYSMLAKFQKLPAPSFPFSMGALKSAATLGRRVVACHHCSLTLNTALQNSMLLGTLVQLLIMEYAKLLNHIDERCKQAERIPFRLGDPSSLYDSRHTGLPDCPMSINVDFSSDEWRTLARKAVAQEVLGNSPGSLSLVGLVQEMNDRRILWRERFSTGLCTEVHTPGHQHSTEHPDHLCAQAVHLETLKRSLKALGL